MTRLASWFDERTGWARARAQLEMRTVAGTLELHLLALGLSLFGFLVASGVLLMLHYRPNVGDAQASILRIEGAVWLGSLIRGVHTWSSDGLVAVMLAYVLALLARRGYRRPRELVWWGALATTLVVLAIAFSGRLLSWSAEAERHAQLVANAAGELPVVGGRMRSLLLGGSDAGEATLPRAFGFHVAVLPALLTLSMALHAGFVARSARPLEGTRMPLYPDALVRLALIAVGALWVVVTLATFVPPNVTAAGPPWYLAAAQALARMSTMRALVALTSMSAVVLVALPFLDPRGSRLVAYLAWLLLAALVVLTIHAMA